MPLPGDFDLLPSHLHVLSGRDEVAALFAALGYNTDARLTQTAEAMGLTAENFRREIRHIERIADHEGGALQVYLAEFKSVTVASTQALARGLRNRAGNFLWVLTSDYERLDFVLMERTLPTAQPEGGIMLRGAFLRPRVLSVDRRDPGPMELRVLRRFSFTEADADYQFHKLQSAYAIAEWSEPFFNNRALFSDYYLSERLKDSPDWTDPELGPALREFKALIADVRQRVGGKPESVARSELLEPALKALGFALKPGEGDRRAVAQPDYYLFAGSDRSKPVALCDAYVWDRILDGRDERRDADTPDENPGALVVSLLEREDAPDWAIVTNGKTWRLYSKRAHSRATNYYEIDLEETVASPDPGFAFRYFWLIFRAAAFTPGPVAAGIGREAKGQSFLLNLADESNLYAKQLGERLKDRVFEGIFPEFAAGFIAQIRTDKAAQAELDDKQLHHVFHGTLTFLYRLLFLLYAEARDLLPVREVRGYHEISLTKLKLEVAERAGRIEDETASKLHKAYSPTSTDLYDRLARLFAVIDQGGSEINVPIYNGGLFITRPNRDDKTPEADNARFLASYKIPDRFLALGLDRMARDLDDKTQSLVQIDYKSLGVRQLGSIYEGVLEFKLRIAPERMAVVKGKNTDEIIPYKEAKKGGLRIHATLPKGAVYLENDKRERKATGSYYTPDYIVKYIVEQTVGPLLADKTDVLRPKLRESQRTYLEAVKRHEALQKQGMKGDDPGKVAKAFRSLVDDMFDLRVLDPAMGSGHFLVEAVDFITDHMLGFLNAFPWNPVTEELHRTRETILAETERQGVTIDPDRLTDVNLLKRHVLKRCIYGVDLNPMAVELAKVSLWLDCFTLGAPLSFLDHHLKFGNSIIGAWVEETRAAIEMVEKVKRTKVAASAREYRTIEHTGLQFQMFGSLWTGAMLATDLMRKVGELPDMTAEQVRQSRADFHRATDALSPFRRILDVYTSRWFGNPDTKLDQPALRFLRDETHIGWLKDPVNARGKLNKADQNTAEIALRAARERCFFHWELEFPEVFFGPTPGARQAVGLKETPGFDAVVGNPPYVSAWQMTEHDEGLREAIAAISPVKDILRAHWDLYIPFLLQAYSLIRQRGSFSYILPNPFAREKYAVDVRMFLLTKATLAELVSFGEENVFEEVSRQTLVAVFRKSKPEKNGKVLIHDPMSVVSGHASVLREIPQQLFVDLPGHQIRHEASANEFNVLERIEKLSFRLGNLCYVNYGAQVSSREKGAFGKAHLISATRGRGNKPFFEGKDLHRYSIAPRGLYLDYKPGDMYGPRSPKLFESEKLILRKISGEGDSLVVALDRDGLYCDDGLVLATFYENVSDSDLQLSFDGFEKWSPGGYRIEYLIAVVASRLEGFFYRLRFATGSLQSSFSHVYPQHVRNFPLRRIAFSTAERRRTALVREGTAEAAESVGSGAESVALGSFCESKMGGWVQARLDAQPEEADCVHDLLAHLAGQMIELNKEKQVEMRRFLGWLGDVLEVGPEKGGKVGIEALTGMSKLRGYLGDYQKGEGPLLFDELLDILHKNRNRIGVSLSDAKFTARLKAEYEKTLTTLLPLKSRLARTDRLIDLIVYKLYGLTEEEVGVVEARA